MTARAVDFGKVGLPRLLFALLRQRFTGVVRLPQDQPAPGTRTIWFRGGMPIYTDWVSPTDALGEVLMQRGLIGGEVYARALTQMAEEGGLLGQVMLRQGVLDAARLGEALRLQCSRKMTHMFKIRSGQAQVEVIDHGMGDGDDLKQQVNVLGLIRHGVDKHYSPPEIQRELRSVLTGPIAASPAFERYKGHFGFPARDMVLLQKLQRGTTLDELDLPGLERTRVLQTIYVLWACQMLQGGEAAAQTAAQSAAAPPPPPPPAPVAAAGERPTTLHGAEGTRPASKTRLRPPAQPAASSPPAAPAAKDTPAPASPATPSREPAPAGGLPPPKIPRGKLGGASKPSKAPSATERGKRTGDEDPAFMAQLDELSEKVKKGVNAFELFGLELDAGRKDVRKVWTGLSKDFHPDSLEGRGLAHLIDEVEHVFAALSEAYGTLSNKESRAQLVELIKAGGTGKAGEDPNQVARNALEADMIARDADKLLKAKAYARALEGYQKALELAPGEPDVLAGAAWCHYQVAGRDPAAATEAKRVLTEVLEEAPNLARARYFLGMVYSGEGNEALARDHFKKALEANPRLVEAQRQLRALQIKKKAAQKEAKKDDKSALGSLKGLFGRK